MQRPTEREFLQAVLRDLADLPPDLAGRLVEALDVRAEDRAEALRRLFEEAGRG